MTSLDELFAGRRSIRRYAATPVPESLIDQLLQPAALIPSSSNSQPVRLLRIGSPEVKARLRAAIEEGRQGLLQQAKTAEKPKKVRNWINAYYRYSRFMVEAPVLLALATPVDPPGLYRTLSEGGLKVPARRLDTDADITVGLALQSIMLKSLELGLGSCVLTAPLCFIADPETILGLEDLQIKCFLTIGFPDEKPKSPPKKTLSEIYRNL